MGRKPNPLILQFFERGPKLADNSNRYPHTCKACGESFPKGRIDSLTNHLTRRCPAISETDRVRACLAIHGFTRNTPEHNSKGSTQSRSVVRSSAAGLRGPTPASASASAPASAHTPAADATQDLEMRDWTALETLAEVSRQIDLSEKHDDRGNPVGDPTSGDAVNHSQERRKAHMAHEQAATEVRDSASADATEDSLKAELSPEERLHDLLRAPGPTSQSTALSVAAAVTARLNPSLLDPQLREEMSLALLPMTESRNGEAQNGRVRHVEARSPAATASIPPETPAQPWGELTHPDLVASSPVAPTPHTNDEIQTPVMSPLSPTFVQRGGFRMSSPTSGKARHSRARFEAYRRKEVQEVRKIGACIRCRILRKTCSKGHPCDTCRKVLSPRIWKSGCVRTKFSEQLDLYSAGVQIVLAQHRINSLKAAMQFVNQGAVLEVSLFPETAVRVCFDAYQSGAPKDTPAPDTDPSRSWAKQELMMIDYEKEDVPAKVELYMRQILPEFVAREKSRFAKVTLETAMHLSHKSNDELLKKAIELWGLVEMLDRERQWSIVLQYSTPPAMPDGQNEGGCPGGSGSGTSNEVGNDISSRCRLIKDTTDQETFTSICLQLTAAAERKAAATSKALLTGMQRVLQDSKTKIDHNMFLTTLILLNCVEKTTWAFKAWEQDTLMPMWPLERPPANFTQQGYVLSDLLKMLLGIRKALPRTYCRPESGLLATQESDPVLVDYFHHLGLTYADVHHKQEHPMFSPTDSRSLELLFCSTLLLPNGE